MANPEHPSHRDPRVIQVTIDCTELPAPDWGGHEEIWFGIQNGKEVVQTVKLPAQAVCFHAELRLGNEPEVGNPNFLGPYAHGTVRERFLYLCWGRPIGKTWVGFRRIKVPLTGLTWKDLEENQVLARLRCTDAEGNPICATVKSPYLTWPSADQER